MSSNPLQRRSATDARSAASEQARDEPSKPSPSAAASSSRSVPRPHSTQPYTPSRPRPGPRSPKQRSTSAYGTGTGTLGGGAATRTPRPNPPVYPNGRGSPALRRASSSSQGSSVSPILRTQLGTAPKPFQVRTKKKRKKKKEGSDESSESSSVGSSSDAMSDDDRLGLSPAGYGQTAQGVFDSVFALYDTQKLGSVNIRDFVGLCREIEKKLGTETYSLLPLAAELQVGAEMGSDSEKARTYMEKREFKQLYETLTERDLVNSIQQLQRRPIEAEGEAAPSTPTHGALRRSATHSPTGRPRPPRSPSPRAPRSPSPGAPPSPLVSPRLSPKTAALTSPQTGFASLTGALSQIAEGSDFNKDDNSDVPLFSPPGSPGNALDLPSTDPLLTSTPLKERRGRQSPPGWDKDDPLRIRLFSNPASPTITVSAEGEGPVTPILAEDDDSSDYTQLEGSMLLERTSELVRTEPIVATIPEDPQTLPAKQINDIVEQYLILHKRDVESTKKVTELRAKADRMQGELSDDARIIANMEATIRGHDEKMDDIQKELRRLEQADNTSNKMVQEMENEKAMMMEELRDIQSSREADRRQLAERQKSETSLRALVKSAEEKARAAQVERDQMGIKLVQTEKKLEKQTATTAALQEQFDALLSVYEKIQMEYSDLQTEFRKVQQDNDSLTRDVQMGHGLAGDRASVRGVPTDLTPYIEEQKAIERELEDEAEELRNASPRYKLARVDSVLHKLGMANHKVIPYASVSVVTQTDISLPADQPWEFGDSSSESEEVDEREMGTQTIESSFFTPVQSVQTSFPLLMQVQFPGVDEPIPLNDLDSQYLSDIIHHAQVTEDGQLVVVTDQMPETEARMEEIIRELERNRRMKEEQPEYVEFAAARSDEGAIIAQHGQLLGIPMNPGVNLPSDPPSAGAVGEGTAGSSSENNPPPEQTRSSTSGGGASGRTPTSGGLFSSTAPVETEASPSLFSRRFSRPSAETGSSGGDQQRLDKGKGKAPLEEPRTSTPQVGSTGGGQQTTTSYQGTGSGGITYHGQFGQGAPEPRPYMEAQRDRGSTRVTVPYAEESTSASTQREERAERRGNTGSNTRISIPRESTGGIREGLSAPREPTGSRALVTTGTQTERENRTGTRAGASGGGGGGGGGDDDDDDDNGRDRRGGRRSGSEGRRASRRRRGGRERDGGSGGPGDPDPAPPGAGTAVGDPRLPPGPIPLPHEEYCEEIVTDFRSRIKLEKLLHKDKIGVKDAVWVSEFCQLQSENPNRFILMAIWRIAHKAERAARRAASDHWGLKASKGDMTKMVQPSNPLHIFAWPIKLFKDAIWDLDRADYLAAGSREEMTRQIAEELEHSSDEEPDPPADETPEQAAAREVRVANRQRRRARRAESAPRQPGGRTAQLLRAGPRSHAAWGILSAFLWAILLWMVCQNVWMYYMMKRDQHLWEAANGRRSYYGDFQMEYRGRGEYGELGDVVWIWPWLGWRQQGYIAEQLRRWGLIENVMRPG